ncbi:hypothetical protein DAEQUDRAFT_727175 [Daedalea quercina L-15889]|uniref:Uncharacterized protein n=1 Tax=Daedalea quercina L-15889 TaxID=1314783 RepID=A0A165Q4L8_9APHY|nr:hypothetical protein DAEQUDRAFT_727175 [Daedalea quercina L-15889]
MRRTRRSLDMLPSELIWEILRYRYSAERANHVPRRYSTLNSVLRVNRRLREFAQRLLLKDISFARWDGFLDEAERFWKGFAHHAHDVRTIQIGRMTDKSLAHEYFDLPGAISPRCLPFSKLQSFSCWSAVTNSYILSSFRLCPEVKTFNLIWDQQQGFPNFSPWQRLETLRLHFIGDPCQTCMYPATIPSYDTLTTLSILEEAHSSWLCSHLREATFPKLRVLSVLQAACPPHLMYNFIHRHPTLLEVNISLHPDCDDFAFGFDGLLKLIDGTGTWTDPTDPKGKRSADIIGWAFDDDSLPMGTPITFLAFAFARVPLYPQATEWHEPVGSPRPRYAATALALEVDSQDEWEDMGFRIVRLHDFLATMAPRLPRLEVLRLGYHTDYKDWNFTGLMRSCAESLKKWSHLRKLAFCWGDLVRFKWCGGSTSPSPLWQVEPPVNLPYTMQDHEFVNLDEHYPKLKEGTPFTLEHIRMIYEFSDIDIAEGIKSIQEVLNKPVNPDEAIGDPHLAMLAWQEPCERKFVAPMMRLFAENCPTLEEIEWYPVGPFFVDHAVRWLWTVHRERTGKGVRAVTGELNYLGCPKGDAPEFDVLVGQELDLAVKDRKSSIY